MITFFTVLPAAVVSPELLEFPFKLMLFKLLLLLYCPLVSRTVDPLDSTLSSDEFSEELVLDLPPRTCSVLTNTKSEEKLGKKCSH